MWKRVVLILVVLVILGYGALWFRHAGETEAKMVQMLADISGKEGQPATGVKVTYDDISVTGFPMEFVTHITNPVITIDTAQVLSKLQPAAAPSPEEAQKDAEVITLKGDILFSVNYFTRSFGLKVDGDSEGESQINGQKLAWQTKQQGLAGCTISMSKDADMSMFKSDAFKPFENPEQLFNTFKSIDCLADPMEVTNKDTGDMLYRGGDQIFSVSMNKLAENEVTVNAAITSRDLEVSDMWQGWMDDIMRSFNPNALNTGVLPISSYEAVGKQNAEFKMHYQGPMRFENLEDADIKLDIPTFNFSSNLYTLSFPLTANITLKGGQTTGDVTFKGTTVYGEKIDEYAKKSVVQMVDTIYASDPEGVQNPLSAIASSIGKEALVERIQAVIPALAELKEFNTTLDVSFKGTKGQQVTEMNGESTIRSLDLRAGQYGFSATGSASFPPPRGEISIRCHTCNDTVDKLVLYLINVQKLISLLDPNTPQFPDSIAFRTAVAGFVTTLSTPADDKPEDRVILVSDSGNGQTVISGKTMQEVTMLGMQTFMPFLTPQQPQGMPAPQGTLE